MNIDNLTRRVAITGALALPLAVTLPPVLGGNVTRMVRRVPDGEIVKFEALDFDKGMEARGTLTEWLRRAESDFINFGMLMALFKFDQDGLFSIYRDEFEKDGDNGFEQFDVLASCLEDTEKWHAGSIDLCQTGIARHTVTRARVTAESTPG